MRRKELFYSGLKSFLTNLSSEMENYYNPNSSDIDNNEIKSSKYTDFNSEIENITSYIDNSYNSGGILPDLSVVENFKNSYEAFLIEFPTFGLACQNYLNIWILLAGQISRVIPDPFDMDENVNISDFAIRDLTQPVVEKNFIYFEAGTLDNSIVIFSIDSVSLTSFINTKFQTAHCDILFIWMHLLNVNIGSSTQYVLIKNVNNLQANDLRAILKLKVLLSGELIKSVEQYNVQPCFPHKFEFDYSKKYLQFESISNILNEYNNQKFLLDKYLKLYHIIENFMYKHKICSLQALRGADPFLIRDFQMLYDRFSSSESAVIGEFFTEVFKEDYDDIKNIGQMVKDSWSSLTTIDNSIIPEIDNLFKTLSLKSNYSYARIATNLDANMFSVLVYKFRNNIVHNKDSEVHFESTDLAAEVKFLIEKFFIPVLEKIIYHLIINHNDIVWYSNHQLLLYNN